MMENSKILYIDADARDNYTNLIDDDKLFKFLITFGRGMGIHGASLYNMLTTPGNFMPERVDIPEES